MHPHDTPNGSTPFLLDRRYYGRNSSDEQHKKATIDSQVNAVNHWSRSNGGNPDPDHWYIDEGWSGFTMHRPALARLRRDIKKPGRDWHELVIYDTSRLSRDPIHRLGILEPELKKAGIKIIYIASPLFDDNADGRFMAWQQAGMDRWYAEKSKDNM
jgi:DNA invertase Pin-like site-specific DNA recombinase